MASEDPKQEETNTSEELALPVAAIVCIAIGAYIVVVVIILIIRQALLKRGVCARGYCCGKEGEPCCECCISCSEGLNCCGSPSLEACLDSICPARKTMDCADIITCQCCNCCGGEEPCCDCGNCNCNCDCNCENFQCLCFTIKSKAPPVADDGDDNYGYED